MTEIPRTNRLLLCSGYISEGNYSTLMHPPHTSFIDAIHKGCSGEGSEVVTIAGRFFGPWGSRPAMMYEQFVRRLRSHGIKVTPHAAPRRNWHARVAMKLKDETPIAAIIGSSNLTQPAFREDYSGYNHECDVVLWRNDPALDKYFGKEIVRSRRSDDPFSPIEVIFNRETGQPDEGQRLEALYREIMGMGQLEPFVDHRPRPGFE